MELVSFVFWKTGWQTSIECKGQPRGGHVAMSIDANTWQLMLCAPENMVRSPKIAATQRDLTAPAPVRGTLQNWPETQEAGHEARRTGSHRASDKSSTGLKCYRQ